ncbi:MAG: alpha/beta hydrolase [Actinobacteria bacterium]|nr:MAG: alpha/beta hydrolase [Actinomycetota bacterium]
MRLHLHEWGDPGAPPIVCLHGVSAHGRRYRRLPEERLAKRFRVLAPDLRGHGLSSYEPPWTIATQLEDILETLETADAEPRAWIGHSYGARLVLELCARQPDRVACAVLLDPAIQILPHVGLDFAEDAARDYSFGSADEAIAARLANGAPTPREFLEEEAREHLVTSPDGRLRWRFCRPAVVTAYGELCTDPPSPTVFGVPVLLVHASQFGLVREDQLTEYREQLGDRLEVVGVPGGHVVYWDAYEQTANAVEEFLARHTSVTHA